MSQIPPANEPVCAILTGKASDASSAAKLVRASRTCPYVALYTAKDANVVGVFCLPRDQQRWVEYPRSKPKFLQGLQDVVVVVTDQVQASSPWSRGDVKPEAELTPCKKRCDRCPEYGEHCAGCPATIFFYAAE